jgi:TIR domain
VSHASEDNAFAEWLTLKLTAEGYKVWCDRFKLLGGESYPKDIDLAIKNQTFRLLALMSKSSVHKENPRKERTLALNISKERQVDFVIPLNLDGLKATDLDWMTSDIIFIPFHGSWFLGLQALLKKLGQIEAPRTAVNGRAAVRDWFAQENPILRKTEEVWSNLVPIVEIPKYIYRYDVPSEIDSDQLLMRWPFYLQDATTAWSFQPAGEPISRSLERLGKVEWARENVVNGMRATDLVSATIRRSVEYLCLKRGLVRSPDRRHLYFNPGLIENDHLRTAKPVETRSYVKSVGLRRYRTIADGVEKKETSQYHLSPQFKPFFGRFGQSVLAMRIYVFWTDTLGKPRSAKKAFRLRRKLARTWYNKDWFMRQKAVLGFLANWEDECTVVATPDGSLKIQTATLQTTSPVSINEPALEAYATDVGHRTRVV